jgi:hypothetical protein
MRTKIVGHSGGYQNTHWDLDAVPREGERLRVYSETGIPWEGVVEQVTHVARQNRPDDVVLEVELVEKTLHKVPHRGSRLA